jgi:putative FmdB family regulatory protein
MVSHRAGRVFSEQHEELVLTMPTYVYKCDECGITFERFQHFSEDPLRVCPECNGPVFRMIQPVGIIFRGSGFYVTDHKGASSSMPKPDSKRREKETEPAGESGSDAPPTDALDSDEAQG